LLENIEEATNVGNLELLLEKIGIPVKESYTYRDYALLPEGAPYQLIGGKLIMTPAPGTFHQVVVIRLVERLLEYNAKEKAGQVLVAPVDVYLEERETYQPDIIFISRERLSIIEPARVAGPPDVVMEVLSPSTAYYDLKSKARIYAKHGVKEYWIVDPEDKSIEVYTGQDGGLGLHQRVQGKGKVSSLLLAEFAVEAAEVFAAL